MPYAANPGLYCEGKHEVHRLVFIGTPYGSRKKMLLPLIKNDIPLDLYCLPNIPKPASDSKTTNKRNHFFRRLSSILYHFFNKLSFKIGRKLLYSSFLRRFSKIEFDINKDSVNAYPAVNFSSLFTTYSHYCLSLSSTNAVNTGFLKTPVPIINLRNFEIPMAGLAQICFYNEELSHYFEEGKEIIFYRNEEELIEKCNYYLKEENQAELLDIGANARKKCIKEHSWFCRFKRISG